MSPSSWGVPVHMTTNASSASSAATTQSSDVVLASLSHPSQGDRGELRVLFPGGVRGADERRRQERAAGLRHRLALVIGVAGLGRAGVRPVKDRNDPPPGGAVADPVAPCTETTNETTTVTPDEIIAYRRRRRLALADALDDVSAAGRQRGVSRTRSDEWTRAAEHDGLDAPTGKSRRKPQLPNARPTHAVRRRSFHRRP